MQYKWLDQKLAEVDRTKTPWLLLVGEQSQGLTQPRLVMVMLMERLESHRLLCCRPPPLVPEQH